MRIWLALLVSVGIASGPLLAQGDLRGHGGPVRALAIAPSSDLAISGSFDQSAIVWSLAQGKALRILRFHSGSVNAVLALKDGFVTGGEDGKVAIWRADGDSPVRVFQAHSAPVAGLALSPDGNWLASAGWDGAVKLQDLRDGGGSRSFEGHKGIVNAVAFMPDGQSLVSGGYDAHIIINSLTGDVLQTVVLPAPVSTLAVAADETVAAGCADGNVVFLNRAGTIAGSIAATETPVTSLAISPDGHTLAAGSPRGAVTVIDIAARRVRFTLNGPGLPVWSMVFTRDGGQLLTGGADRIVRRWDATSGEHIGAIAGAGDDDELGPFRDMRGADIFRACSVCHTVRPDGAGRAGPSLYGLFGRKAGSLPGYSFSEAFRKLDLVWTEETVSRLFEIGPQAFTPGTKMPEQTVGNAKERQALIDFLQMATAAR